MTVAQTVESALKSATLYSDDLVYVMVSLPVAAVTAAAGVIAEISEPFTVMIVDKDEITLVLTEAEVTEFSRRLPGATLSDARYRLITFDIPLEPTLVGFMKKVSGALSAAGVTLMPFAAFQRDHILVPADQYEQARTALKALQQ
jgi:hypothetical protein